MAGVHELTRAQARRIAVRAQLLDADRPAGLLDLVRRLTLLQSDATDAVAPSADLVAWSRLGSEYRPEQLVAALRDGSLIELRGMIRPGEDIALYRAEMADWPGSGEVPGWRQANDDWIRVNDDFRQDILERLEQSGPLTSRELPDTCLVPWRSSGWNNHRNASMMLELLEQRGEVAVAGRRAGTGCGTWPSGSIPTTRWCRWPRRCGSATSAGSGRWASSGPGPPRPRSSRWTWVRSASRP